MRALLRVLAASVVVSAACSVLVDPEVGRGIGAPCSADDQCQASSCTDGICAIGCNDTAGCPGGAVCARSLCQLPLSVTYVHGGDPASDELTRSFEDGRVAADAELAYTSSDADPGHALVSDAVSAAADAADGGAQVIVSSLPDPGASFAGFVAKHPGSTVLALRSTATEPGLVSFDARTYQAYYLAGIAAARLSTTQRIGIVATVAMPEVVASVNGFALGAQRVSPGVTVEVLWLHSFHDPSPPGPDSMERVLARRIDEAGDEG
ncbi:MAG TPA: BMP family ABC transporter substrate-binding protein, partial [Polyangiaceae bacterium]|nr:BMP family ABC transporter substrate-binding protein [Polyangiaceae bacterium]